MEKRFQLKMVKLMLKNDGFTMIETLFVLFVICILSCLTIRLHIPSQNDDIMIENLSQLLNQAKMNAMIYKEKTYISFQKRKLFIQSIHFNKEYFLRKDLSFESHEMSYNEYGNINKAKRIHLYSKQRTYSFVFQIGSGSYYVQ